MEKIDIAGFNINFGGWIHRRPAKAFKFMEKDGVKFAITENNYYLDTKKNKIRYNFMDCKGASYDHLYAVYMRVRPGVYALTQTATEDNLNDLLERFAKIHNDNDYPKNSDVGKYVDNLKRVE